MSKEPTTGEAVFLGCLMTPVLLVIGCVGNGYAVMTLWDWFVTPLHVDGLSLAQAIGIASLVSLLTYQQTKTEKNTEGVWTLFISATIQVVMRPVFAVAFGWFVLWCGR